MPPKECNNNTEVCEAIRPIVNPSVNAANNRLNGYLFDNAGNTIRDAESRRFTYDGENKQVKVETLDLNGNPVSTVGEYSYDGDGRRIKKHVPSTGEVTVFVYDAGGKLIGEYSTLAETQSPQVSYTTADNLGSPRILTDQNGTTISRRDFMPYGEEIARTAYGSDNVRQKFTTYERDGETDLDFAQARMYGGGHGRFSSPDPYGGSGFVSVPQSWNRYVYSLNRPTVFVDPSGLIWLTTDNRTFMWVDDKEYEKNQKLYKDYEVANGAVIFLHASSRKQDRRLIGSYVSLGANGRLEPAAEPATVDVEAEYDDDEISNPWGGLGTLRTPVDGTPNTYKKFRGNKPGKYTLRFFDAKGHAKIDIDFGHDHGKGDPHAHWWDWDNEAEGPRMGGEGVPVGSEEAIDEDGDRIIIPPANVINPFVVLPAPGRVPVPARPINPVRIPLRVPVLVPVIP